MRKVLSFVLVLTLVLSSFSMAFATEAQNSLSDIAGHANEEAITVDFNLGIIDGMGDGTFAPDQAVNRAQFAAMITRALAIPDSALAGYTATSFKDTAGYGWATSYLAFCQSKGILVGDGAGNVMPGRTVSVNEAMTMILRAVGYTNNSAALVGVWPANYVSLAQNNDLYDDVATAVGVTRANAAQIIYNALTVDKVEVASDGKTTVLSDRTNDDETKWDIVNMLTTGLNCYAESTTISGEEESQINLKAYVGKTVTAFYNSDDEIVAIASVDSDAVAGEFAADVELSVSGTSIYLSSAAVGYTLEGDDDVDYTVKDNEVYNGFVLNGEIQTLADTDGYALTSDTSITINGDVNGKNIKSIDTIATWVESNAKKVGKADINSIADDSLLGSDFTTLKDGSIDKNSFDLVGVKSLDDIKADNVVYVYEKGGNGDIVKVEVGTKVVEGKVTTTKSNGDKIVVAGTTYEQADSAKSTDFDIKAGDEVKLFLDVNGDVFDYDITSGSNDKYAAVLDTDTKYDKVKLYTTDDDSAWFEYDSDYEGVFTTGNAIDNIGLVAYGLDKDGAVDTATTGGVDTATAATLTALTLKTDAGDSYKVDADAAVYAVTGGAVDFYTKVGDVDRGENLGDIGFITDEDGVVVALMVYSEHASATADDSYAVISEVNSTENADEDSVQQVIGFMDGAALDKLTTDDDTANVVDTDNPGLYKVEFDSDGVIKTISVPTNASGVDNWITTGGFEVSDIDGNNIQITSGGVVSDWLPVATDAKVYRAVLDDGDVDSYKVSDVGSINTEYRVWLYNTVDDDDSTGADGYDVVIFVTKGDAE